MSGSPWALLGVPRTADEATVRRAYAAKLKAIDVDADPAAFVALRQAMEIARAQARRRAAPAPEPMLADAVSPDAILFDQQDEEEEEEEEQAETFGLGTLDDLPLAAPVAPAAPEEPPAPPPWADDIGAIQHLVFGDAPRETIFDEVQARLHRLLYAPEMEGLDHAAAVENWTIDTILSGMPRTNAMLWPAIERFDWGARVQQWNCPPAIRQVLVRYADCGFIGELAEDNPLRQAFTVLRDPAIAPTGKLMPAVERLLAIAEGPHPTLRSDFDADALAAWRAFIAKRHARLGHRLGAMAQGGLKRAGGLAQAGWSGRGWLRLGWFALILITAIARCATSDFAPSTPPQGVYAPAPPAADSTGPTAVASPAIPPLHDEKGDIARASLAMGVGWDGIDKNPKLRRAVADLWQQDSAGNLSPSDFIQDVETLFGHRLWRALPHAPYALVAHWQRLRLRQAQTFLDAHDATACAALLEGGTPPHPLPSDYLELLNQQTHRIVAETRTVNVSDTEDQRFSVPGTIVTAARERSGLDDAAFSRALLRNGPASDRCRTHIALLETLLAAPPGTALALLRKL